MLAFLASPALAIGFGAFMFCAETCLHLEDIRAASQDWLTLPLYDWAGAGFLIFGSIKAGGRWTTGRAYQAAAWAFMASLLTGALLGGLQEWSAPPAADAVIPDRVLTVIVGVLFAVAVGALWSTLTVDGAPVVKDDNGLSGAGSPSLYQVTAGRPRRAGRA